MTTKLVDPQVITIPATEITVSQAADSISFYNPEGQEPYVAIVEVTRGQTQPTIDRTTYVARASEIPTYPLVDPTTGEPTGVVKSVAEIYADLYSLYVHMRNMPKPGDAPIV